MAKAPKCCARFSRQDEKRKANAKQYMRSLGPHPYAFRNHDEPLCRPGFTHSSRRNQVSPSNHRKLLAADRSATLPKRTRQNARYVLPHDT